MYILMGMLTSRALWYFRKTGGIRGLNKRTGLIEDKIIGAGKFVASAVGNKASQQMDKQDKKALKNEVE